MPEVVIIGAGPAGTTAAIALARRGHDVLIVEQHRFPREKVCGECLSAEGIDVLEELGIRNRIGHLRPAVLTRTLLHSTDGFSADLPLPRPMWGISRFRLDQELLNAAAESGVQVLQPARCETIYPGDRPRVRVRDLAANRIREIDARLVIVADGKGGGRTRDLGIKTWFYGLDAPADSIELFGVQGHYGGLAQVEGERWNAAFSVPAALAGKYRGDLDALMLDAISQNPVLDRRLSRAKRDSPWLAAPLPRFGVQKQWEMNVIPVGNAAAALEPIGGEGMGLAMRSAMLAAEWIDANRGKQAADVAPLRNRLASLWRSRRAACRAMGLLISNPATASFIVSAADAAPALRKAVLRLIGKSDARLAGAHR
jgi:flavin-dependent dehydrogenase